MKAELGKASRIISVSHAIAHDLESRLGAPRVTVIPNGVFAERICNKNDIMQGDTVVFTLVGRIDANKRQQDALRAFIEISSEFPQARLKFVGTGDAEIESELRAIADDSSAKERIEFCGYRSDMPQVWRETDVALNCSFSEGCSMVVAEAMSSGCLVLCSNAEGNAELVDKDTGLLYERCDAEDLAQKMRWVLEHPLDACEMASRGKACALRRFSIDAQLDSVMRVFYEVLA